MVMPVEHATQIIKIKLETRMLKSSLCDYSDAYVLVKGTITIAGQLAAATSTAADRKNKQVIFQNFSRFTDCISEISNTHNHVHNIFRLFNC